MFLLAALGLFFFLMARPVSAATAKQLLNAGAKVIDVRSPAEFASGAVKGAINIPLESVASRIASVVPDKSTPLLVHCLSGGRSAVARGILRRAGYAHTHNLGSLARAKQIVET
ncbi:MAG: hypothetical protein RLY20_1238 [Verrucomicrobiota bacterium]